MIINFTKMHGLGNDFIVIDDRAFVLKNPARIAMRLLNRRLGIGADQLLVLSHSASGDFHMRIFNPDGSEVEMCGNGIRCLGKFLWDNILDAGSASNHQPVESLSISTKAGIIGISRAGRQYKVDMGEPIFQPDLIPLKVSSVKKSIKDGIVVNHPLKISGTTFNVTCVSMGNPHAVIFVKDADKIVLSQYGPIIENHTIFPNRTNVEFVEVISSKKIKVRVWERGAGETMACGTGASASAVAAALLGHTGRNVVVELPGGNLAINWSAKDNRVYMKGPAETVFTGTIEL